MIALMAFFFALAILPEIVFLFISSLFTSKVLGNVLYITLLANIDTCSIEDTFSCSFPSLITNPSKLRKCFQSSIIAKIVAEISFMLY